MSIKSYIHKSGEPYFTIEAEKILEIESQSIAKELREAAINEALISRGEPIEVTACDVMKARVLFQMKQLKLEDYNKELREALKILAMLVLMIPVLIYFPTIVKIIRPGLLTQFPFSEISILFNALAGIAGIMSGILLGLIAYRLGRVLNKRSLKKD